MAYLSYCIKDQRTGGSRLVDIAKLGFGYTGITDSWCHEWTTGRTQGDDKGNKMWYA